jgi:hypothetical protein
MRNYMAGFAVLGLLTVGTMASASARPLAVPPVGPSPAVQQTEWDGCGPRCWEHRREERERERERRADHRRWEEHRGWDDRQHRY